MIATWLLVVAAIAWVALCAHAWWRNRRTALPSVDRHTEVRRLTAPDANPPRTRSTR